MKVRRNSWHYRLIKHRAFASKIKDANKDTMNYLCEVYLGIWCLVFAIPLALIALCAGLYAGLCPVLSENFFKAHLVWLYIYFLIAASPLWIEIIRILIEPLTTKSWRRLEIIQ